MKECHTCPVHAQIMSGKHASTSWHRLPCSTCPSKDLDSKNAITGTRALRGRVGETRLSLDYETADLIDSENRMHSHDTRPELSEVLDSMEAVLHWLNLADSLLKSLHAPSPIRDCVSRAFANLDPLRDFLKARGQTADSSATDLGHEVQQLLFRCVQDLFGLDHVTRDLVIHRLASRQPIKDCAEKHGISQAVAHARVKEAARRHPWINAAISINS